MDSKQNLSVRACEGGCERHFETASGHDLRTRGRWRGTGGRGVKTQFARVDWPTVELDDMWRTRVTVGEGYEVMKTILFPGTYSMPTSLRRSLGLQFHSPF